MNTNLMTSEQLLRHWQGHRNLTRRVIEAFPEDAFFEFSIAGMRTPAKLISELLSIGGPGLKATVEQVQTPHVEHLPNLRTKADYLKKWDEETQTIDHYWKMLKPEDFGKTFNLFGEYNFPVIQNVLYFIDNEIHHRGQLYVYLRALGVEPPFFWER